VTLAPGRRYFSPMEMSLQAPFADAATSIDPTNQANTFLSYYDWGSGVALGLDLTLRGSFTGKTLDGFMRSVWERFGRPPRRYGLGRLYTVDDLERALGAYVGDAAFAREFFARYVRGRDVPEYAALLAPAGFVVRPAQPRAAFAGPLALIADSAGAVVGAGTIVGTPAYAAGLEAGDRILSAGGAPVRSEAEWTALLAARAPGDELPLVVRQRGRELRTGLRLAAVPSVDVLPVEQTGEPPTEAQRAFRDGWLRSRGGVSP
jgi:predicted metalloprotease with PDZ domain